MEKTSDKRAEFLKIYPNVPEDLRDDIIVEVDGKAYTWDTSYLEIKDNTELGKKILKALVGIVL
jgi:UV DNA damage repair endonuclease